MSRLNPCTRDCPRKCAGCRDSCPEWAAAQELKAKISSEKERERMFRNYYVSTPRRVARRKGR